VTLTQRKSWTDGRPAARKEDRLGEQEGHSGRYVQENRQSGDCETEVKSERSQENLSLIMDRLGPERGNFAR
jgi:hypothetical protein